MTLGKVRFTTLCAGVLAAVAPARAPAQAPPPWRDVGVGPAGRVLLDTAHIVSDTIGLRIRLHFSQPERIQLRDPQGNVYKGAPIYSEIDTYVDCGSRRVWEKEVALVDSAGVRKSGFKLPETTWTEVSRRQTAQLYFDLACAGLRAAGKL
jgi:hypothetical protein